MAVHEMPFSRRHGLGPAGKRFRRRWHGKVLAKREHGSLPHIRLGKKLGPINRVFKPRDKDQRLE
jgi:hypothetical protein